MTKKVPAVSGPELVKLFIKIGYVFRRQKGSHVVLFREIDKRRLTIPVHGEREIPVGTLKSILKDAGLSADDLRRLLSK